MTTWTAGPVCLDELVTVVAQYPTDAHWNGFVIPAMDPHAVEKVMAAFLADSGTDVDEIPTHEWMDDGTLIVTEWDGQDPYPETLKPDEDGLYALGAFAWVWSEDPESTLEEARA